MAKLADAEDLKSSAAKAAWEFESPSRHFPLLDQLILGMYPRIRLTSKPGSAVRGTASLFAPRPWDVRVLGEDEWCCHWPLCRRPALERTLPRSRRLAAGPRRM